MLSVYSSQLFTRLQKLGLCMSHTGVISLLDSLGQDCDDDVMNWCSDITSITLNVTINIIIITISFIFNMQDQSPTNRSSLYGGDQLTAERMRIEQKMFVSMLAERKSI